MGWSRSIRAAALALLTCMALPAWASRPVPPTRATFPVHGVRVGDVQMLGDVRDSNPRRLLRALGIVPGAPYDSVRVERARRDLLAVGWLRSLDLLMSLPAPDSMVVVILVERAPRARLYPAVDLRADDRIVYGGRLYAWGRGGRGERFDLRVAGGGHEILQAEWVEPRPFVRLPLALQFNAELFQEVEEAEDDLEFDRLALGAVVSVPHRGPRLELSGSVLQVRASQPEGTFAGGNVDHLRRGAVHFVWGRPHARFDWSAWRGRVGVGATSGAAESQNVLARASVVQRLAQRVIVAAGWTYRDVRGRVPRYDRIHLGGGASVRAHEYGVVNGDGGTWGGVELRVPANFWSAETFRWSPLPVALHGFFDSGAAWSASAPGAQSEASRRSQARFRWSAGVGITAWFRGAYPIRADVGAGDDGHWRADLSTSFPF